MTAADDPDIAANSWRFALGIYGRPGVADACLKLQARAGVDVMFLLVVAFAAARRRIRLTSADIAAMDEQCRDWREQVVRPLRALRTRLKSGPQPAPSSATDVLRGQIKASELAAERLQNDLLADFLRSGSSDRHELPPTDIRDILLNVVRHFVTDLPASDADEVQLALDAVAAAVEAWKE